MKVVEDFFDYEIIDAGFGMKYERWKDVYLLRPDPLAMWDKEIKTDKLDAIYHRSNKGGGYWESYKNLENFQVSYQDLKFNLKQMGFKHTGLFPEQAVNWNYLRDKIKKRENVNVLNLFAYTGGASIACLKEGASVVHVDSSKYDVIIMDPPSYGKGANGEIWSLEKDLYNLVNLVQELLSDNPICIMINSYSGLSPIILEDILKLTDQRNGHISSYEIGLKITNNNLILPAGITGIVEYE